MNNTKINKMSNIISVVLIIALIIGAIGYITNGFNDWSLIVQEPIEQEPLEDDPIEEPVEDDPIEEPIGEEPGDEEPEEPLNDMYFIIASADELADNQMPSFWRRGGAVKLYSKVFDYQVSFDDISTIKVHYKGGIFTGSYDSHNNCYVFILGDIYIEIFNKVIDWGISDWAESDNQSMIFVYDYSQEAGSIEPNFNCHFTIVFDVLIFPPDGSINL